MRGCHCCGRPTDLVESDPRFCGYCRKNCVLVGTMKILRGRACPFLRGMSPELPPEPHLPVEPDTFFWKGRWRRNIPGG